MCQDLWQGFPCLSLHLLCTPRSFPLPLLRSFLFSSLSYFCSSLSFCWVPLSLTFFFFSCSFFIFPFPLTSPFFIPKSHLPLSSSVFFLHFWNLGIRFLNSVGKQNNIHLITSADIAIWRDKSLSIDPRGHLTSGQKPTFRGHSKAEVYNGGMKFWTDHFPFTREELGF